MNGYYRHVLGQGLLFGIAITLFFKAYHLWTIRRKESDRQVNEKILFWCKFLGAVVGTVVLGSWAIHNELHYHRTFIVDNILTGDSGESDGVTLLLALIAGIMTLVTAGVVTIARHAIEDIRREKEALSKRYEQLKETDRSLKGGLKKNLKEQSIQLCCLQVLDQTRQELAAMHSSGEEGSLRYQFRSALEACYSKWDSIPFDRQERKKLPLFLKFLDDAYNRKVHGRLLDSEYNLLQKLKKYYTKYELDERKRKKLVSMIDDILRR